MNAHRLRHFLGAGALLLAFTPASLAATPAQVPTQTAQTTQTAQATQAAQALLRPEAKRQAPRKLDVNQPRQESFETGAVQQADITPDGKWLAYSRVSGGYAELWLRSLDPGLSVLPRRLAPALADRLSPALSPDGRLLAFVGFEDDVKGDIHVLDLTKPEAAPKKLTGRDSEDGAPCFAPDGRTLYFHQRPGGEGLRRIMAVDVSAQNPAATLRALPTAGDASSPAPSPDGRSLAYVARENGRNVVRILDFAAGTTRRLTSGAGDESMPRFSADGAAVLFVLAKGDGGQPGTPVIARAGLKGGAVEQLTAASDACFEPLMAGGRLYFLSAQNGPANVWSLPPEGEIPSLPAQGLLELADTIAAQLPVDRQLCVLAYARAAEAARAAGDKALAARALYAQGRQYEALLLPGPALASFEDAAQLGVLPEAGYAKVRAVLLRAAEARAQARNDADRRAALSGAQQSLAALARQPGADARVACQADIEQARLLLEQAGDSKSLMEGVRLLDARLAATAAGQTREQRAEALFLKAEIYARIGQIQAVLPLYAQVIRQYPEDGPWADLAVSRVVDQSLAGAGRKFEDQAQSLVLLADQHRRELPKLALGAQNRLGDVYFRADEWAKAKDAYRQSIDTARAVPEAATQLAAARLALAEILYREERFHQALDLYETEMAARPFEDRLYRLAKAAHLRKSVAAGDYLLRVGEVPSARAIFAGLLRDDPDFVPAHRGMIRASNALKTIPATLAEYRAKLAAKPSDATLLYATGLSMTYLDGKPALMDARELIARAIRVNGQVEYFHQTLGYVDEVLETVHKERGRLEAALESYRRARFLNAREDNPENAANLDLNIGNGHFLLGQFAQAYEEYLKRFESKVPFDNEETEILFYQRFGASAFQAREPEKPIVAYGKSLELVEKRIQPKYASEVFGRINKFVFDRVLTPAAGRPELADRAKALALRQSELNNSLFETSIKPAGPPPDPAFKTYAEAVRALLAEQERIVAELPPLMKQEEREANMQTLAVMAGKVREALGFPPRFVELRAELNDRLGLAYQEVGRWREARESFEKALAMNTALGLTKNLAANTRSVGYAAFMQAGLTTGAERERLLARAEECFRKTPELVKRYGVASKKSGGGKGLINLDLDVALDKGAASQAAYGFSAEQELRLAEVFLSRIATEQGRPREALQLVERQSKGFQKGEVAPQDAFGAALLLHRAGLLESALGGAEAAFEHFRRSAELALGLNNALSASLNVADMAAALLSLPGTVDAVRASVLHKLEEQAAQALRRSAPAPESAALPAFANIMAAHDMALAERFASSDAAQAAALRMDALARSGRRLAEGLGWFAENAPASRRALALNAALRLNQAELALRLGEDGRRKEALESALALSERGLQPGLRWRALAGLGRLPEALAQVEALPMDALSTGPGEILRSLSPLVAQLAQAKKAEQAYNLLERLAEFERVGRMARLGVPSPAEAELSLLRRSGLRLLSLRDLKARLSALKDAAGQERADLSRRVEQEEEILRRELGPQREYLPGVARLGGNAAEQDWLAMLFGLSAELSATADAAVSADLADAPQQAKALRARCADLSGRLATLRAEAAKTFGRGPAPGVMGLFLPAPTEAIELMEALPKASSALRIASTPGGWLGLRLDGDSVSAQSLGSGPLPVIPAAKAGEQRLLLFEEPGLLPAEALESAASLGLSGTHMVRSLSARKPFRRNVLFVTETGQPEAAPKAFEAASAPAAASTLPERLAWAHTLLASILARQAQTAPSRQDEQPARFLALAPAKAEPLSLMGLAPRMQDVSLALLSSAAPEDLPLTAQLLSLFGVPSVLAAKGTDAAFTQPFLSAYAEAPASSARTAAQAKGGGGWLLLGDPGMSARDAGAFAVGQFSRYVRTGLDAFKAGRGAQALSMFENALRVARSASAEQTPQGAQLRKNLPDLLSYARESAYLAEQYDKSLAYAQELAGLVAKAQPDTPAHAEALLRLGLVQARLEQYAKAVPNLEAAAEMLANLELAPKEIEALSSLGAVLENAVQYDKALVRFEGAAKLSRKAGAKELVAKQYMSIGRIHDMRLSQYAQAKAAYGEALAIYTQLGRKGDMAQALLDIGRCQRLIGDFAGAEAKYAEALKLLGTDKAGERTRQRVVMEQANNAWQQARFQQAFDQTRAVQKAAEQNGWALEQLMARNTSGLLWWSLGDHERAIRELDAALPLAESLRIRKDEVATTLNNRGLVERDMGRHEEALATLNQALTIDRALGSRWAIAYDLRNIAQTYTKMGEPKRALPLLDEALAIVAATGNRINQTKILLAQGEANLTLGNVDKARAAFTQADGLSAAMGLRDSRWRALHGLARIELIAKNQPGARKLLEAAVAVVEDMRAELKVDQLKDGFINDKAVVYEDLVTLLADMGEVSEAFRTAERSRARNLIDLLGNTKRSPKRPEDKALYERIAAVRGRLNEQEALLGHAQSPAEREVYAKGVKRAQDEYRDVLLELQANRPDIASLVSVTPLSLPEVQKMLEPGVGLLSYYVTRDEILCWAVDKGRAELVRTRLGRGELSRLVLTYRRMLQNLEPAETHSKELHQLLLAPALPKLAGVKELGIIPHDALHTLSFASLTDGGDYLVDRYPLFQLPSASVFRFTLARRKAERNTRVLAVGNPDLRDHSLELPFAEREVGSLSWNYPNMTSLTREKATKDWITSHIGEFGIIHMATHGEFDAVNPLFSSLKLAGSKKDSDGDLEAAEIFDLKLSADLIVLSACQTGLGKVSTGDEVQGMNQAFLYAGTHALVSSLWRVSDISTAVLMKQFYREYQTRPKAESLRRAMLHVKTRFPHPGYWSAFTLTGDYK